MRLEDIFDAIEDLRDKASVSAVYGEPVAVGEKTIIAVADIKYGFGVGYSEGPATNDEGGELAAGDQGADADEGSMDDVRGHRYMRRQHGQGGGAGGAVAARPVAVLEISDESVEVKPVMDEGRIAMAAFFTGAWFVFWAAKTMKAILGKK
jgi:uncharacterized spore protein YtfJ